MKAHWVRSSLQSADQQQIRFAVFVHGVKTFPMFLPQHVVFFIGRFIDLMVPDVSEEVEMKIKREHYMAKEALAENQVPKNSSELPDVQHSHDGFSFRFFWFEMEPVLVYHCVLLLQSLGKTMIPGNEDAPLSDLRQRRSGVSPQQSDLQEIEEEAEATFSS